MNTHRTNPLPHLIGVALCILAFATSGNLTAALIQYSYDSLNRLTNVNYGNGAVISYTYDVAGNRLTYSGIVTNDAVAPTIGISSPTSGPTFTTTDATIKLSGTASDNTGISLITWENFYGYGIGTASGTTTWSITGIPLHFGENHLLVTAYDSAGNSTEATLTVTVSTPVPPLPTNQLSAIRFSTNGMLLFNLNGPVGSNYVVLVSSNLVNWRSLSTNTISNGGYVPIAELISLAQPCQFYRAVPIGGRTTTARITDLVAYVNSAGVSVLSWTAPAPAIGRTLEEYDLRLSTNAIGTLNWNNQPRVLINPPGPPGGNEVVTLTNLVPQTTYYAAVKTKDSSGSWTIVSSLAHWISSPQGQ